MSERPHLLIDALNLFSRHYARNPSMSTLGHQAGGIVGFLNSLKFLTNLVIPSSIIVVWEGGGSARRRAIYPGYKNDRRPPRLNRYYGDDIPDTHENRMHQVRFLVDVLAYLPVCQLFIEDCEADDVIGYLCRNTLNDSRKVIASSDRDYYQLLDARTMMYSWSSKRFVGPQEAHAELGIPARNIALARAICGDRSDNIPGVRGVGLKTLAKRLPMLAEDADVTLDDVLAECSKMPPRSPRVYPDIIAGADLIRRNFKLMYLDTSNLAAVQVQKIDAMIKSFNPTKNKMKLMKMLLDEGLGSFDVHELFSAFLPL